jgi:hypothetical protein
MRPLPALPALACLLLLTACTAQPKFRDDARVLAARGALEPWEERHDTAAKRAIFPKVSFQPGDAPEGRVEFYVWDDADLQAAHGVLRVRFLPQGWETMGAVVTWVRLFDAQGNVLVEAHPSDTVNEGKDAVAAMKATGAGWHRDAFFDLPKRVAADAVRVEVYLDGFFREKKR